jgi:predicted Zn-dependent protease
MSAVAGAPATRCRSVLVTVAFCLAWSSAAAALVLISVPEEARLGRRAQAAMLAKTPVVTDPAIRRYVSEMGRRLVATAGGPRFAYTFDVANFSDVNAFALPGGHIWIFRGALAASRTESELAGVLAHEVAHVAERHLARQASTAMMADIGLELLSALLGNTGGALTSELAANALTGTAFLGFSREDERAADRAGVRIVERAGWDPRGLASFLEGARTASHRDPSTVEVFFSTHPAIESRVASLRAETRDAPRGRQDNLAFADIKRRLGRLPPAARAPRK